LKLEIGNLKLGRDENRNWKLGRTMITGQKPARKMPAEFII